MVRSLASKSTDHLFVPDHAPQPDIASTTSALISVHDETRSLRHGHRTTISLIREAFDKRFFSSKYRKRFIGRALEAGNNALETYLRFVASDQLDPHPSFSERAYLQDNPDIMEGVATGKLLCGFEHWLRYGDAEARSTSEATILDDYSNPVFDRLDHKFFARKYQRRFAGRNINDNDVALSLYVSFVRGERLDPNPAFSENDYLRDNPDVEEALKSGVLISGFDHWVRFGGIEGRKVSPALTFDGLLSPEAGVVIPRSNKDRHVQPLCLRRDEYEGMLIGFDKVFFFRNRYSPPKKTRERHRAFYQYLNMASDTAIDPNAGFSETHYITRNPDVAAAVKEGGYLCGYHHWVLHGSAENRVVRSASARGASMGRRGTFGTTGQAKISAAQRDQFRRLFQYSYYRTFFPIPILLDEEEAFEHFLNVDLMKGVVPVDENTFDEHFYLCYYGDVDAEKRKGGIPSGYCHYVLSGRSEGRFPTYQPGALLKAKLGDSADPIAITNVSIIANRLQPLMPRISPARPRVLNVFIPTLDGDLMFGGYIAFMNFLCRVAERGIGLRFIIREDPYGNARWFRRTIGNRPRWVRAFSEQEVVNATTEHETLIFNFSDLCIAYSTWTMFDASSISTHLRCKRPIFFIQEYEPIFHEHNSFGFIMASAYELPHLAVFNSSVLTNYFRQSGIGVFSTSNSNPYFQFENALTPLRAQGSRGKRVRRRLICYTRPERHAARNLFEVCILALREAVRRGIFRGDWDFIGVGALSYEYQVPLGAAAVLNILPKMPQADYEQFLLSFDVGLSLMWAPHPSVMPFELAKAGVVTVTNEFANRKRETADQFGANLITVGATLDDIVEGLKQAARRSTDFATRRAASEFGWPTHWDEVFTPAFIDGILLEAQQ